MTEIEKGTMKTIAAALPHMTDYDRGSFVGFARGLLSAQQQKEAQSDISDDAEPDNAPDAEEPSGDQEPGPEDNSNN